jgi:hypothetical protein
MRRVRLSPTGFSFIRLISSFEALKMSSIFLFLSNSQNQFFFLISSLHLHTAAATSTIAMAVLLLSSTGLHAATATPTAPHFLSFPTAPPHCVSFIYY